MNLIPKTTKAEIMRREFGMTWLEYRKYENFFNCHKEWEMRKAINNSICPFCGEAIKENEKQIHHKTYEHKCFSGALFPPCSDCKKRYPEKFNECSKLLTNVCRKCHEEISKTKEEK